MSAAWPAGVAVRVASARTLDAVLHRGRSLKAELARTLPQQQDPRDRALLEAICFAVLRRHTAYETALAGWLARPLPAREGAVRALLLAGLAQLDALGLPPHAALSATVEAVRALDRPALAGLVNAVLRRALREGVPAGDPAQAWPAWLREQVAGDWPEQAAGIFAASARPAPLWLRVDARRTTPAAYAARLRDEAGIDAVAVPALADALRLEAGVPVATLPGFQDGLVSVQDGSAQQVADALAPPAGGRVLDMCAAPGGKAVHLLERDPGLRLLALDIDPRRLQRVAQTLARVGVQAELRAADAAAPAAWWDGVPFDAVLLDAPCSATGIVRRQPDVLLHRQPRDIAMLTTVQARLLDAAWQVVRPGGRLVYATCSILRAENTDQVQAFLARTGQAALEDPGEAFGHACPAGRQRLPGEDGMDGFFYAVLRRVA